MYSEISSEFLKFDNNKFVVQVSDLNNDHNNIQIRNV